MSVMVFRDVNEHWPPFKTPFDTPNKWELISFLYKLGIQPFKRFHSVWSQLDLRTKIEITLCRLRYWTSCRHSRICVNSFSKNHISVEINLFFCWSIYSFVDHWYLFCWGQCVMLTRGCTWFLVFAALTVCCTIINTINTCPCIYPSPYKVDPR